MKFDGCLSRLCKWLWCCSAIAHSCSEFTSIPSALSMGLLCAEKLWQDVSLSCLGRMASDVPAVIQLEQREQAVCFRNPMVAHLLLKGCLVGGQRGGTFCSVASGEARIMCLKNSPFSAQSNQQYLAWL